MLKVENDRIWVRGDLSEGEPVIIERQGYVSPGVVVRIAGEETEEPGPRPAEDADAPAEPTPESES